MICSEDTVGHWQEGIRLTVTLVQVNENQGLRVRRHPYNASRYFDTSSCLEVYAIIIRVLPSSNGSIFILISSFLKYVEYVFLISNLIISLIAVPQL